MAIVIGPGIVVGAGVTVGAGSGGGGVTPLNYRDLLSPTGQANYDAAADGDFFFVLDEDYATVFAAISGAIKIGMTDGQLTDPPETTFTRTLGTTLPEAAATVPANTLLFGFISEHSSGSMLHQPRISTTFKGSYTAIANAPLVSSATLQTAHLRKPGYSSTATTSYIALFPASAGSGSWRGHGGLNTFVGGGYSSNGSSWTDWNNSLPKFQMLGAPA